MDEYVIVQYPGRIRKGMIDDGIPIGRTGFYTMVNRGIHTFYLAGERDYKPTQITLAVDNTTKHNPLVIEFV